MKLNDGRDIPQLGLGLWRTAPGAAAQVVEAAVAAGYRHFDTATMYGNEAEIGAGLRASGLPRAEAFVTTKVWNDSQGFDATQRAARESLARLKLDYVDLYLIHWPSPRRGLYVDTWRALIKLREEGLAKSIGVCNFAPAELERLISETGVTPSVNQVELHLGFAQAPLRAFHAERGVATEAWAPLGRGQTLDHPVIRRLAAKHGRTPAQIVIRWHLEEGIVAIPKTARVERLAENFDVFGFTLGDADRAEISRLDRADGRMGAGPRDGLVLMQEVVFDIGNVLLRWDPRNLYARVFADEAACEAFLAGPLAMEFIIQTDVAESFAAVLAERARAFPEHAAELALFDARWMETLGGAIAENVALLARLKASGARVHALSNFAHEKFAQTLGAFPFLQTFDVAVISGRERVAKPDPRIFQILLERTGRGADELLFIDDSARNVAAARSLGIETIHYAPGVDLEAEFFARKLLR